MGTLTRFNLEIIKQDWPGDVFVEIKHPSDNNTFSESYVRKFYLNYFSVQDVDEVLSDPIVSSAETGEDGVSVEPEAQNEDLSSAEKEAPELPDSSGENISDGIEPVVDKLDGSEEKPDSSEDD